MEIKYKNYTLEAKSYQNAKNWGHKCYFYIASALVDKTKIVYYNRTWERYQFESILNKMLYRLKNSLLKEDWEAIEKLIKNYR